MMLNPAVWRDVPVFLTGHTGFKGSWLALWLAQLGARVHGYALAPATQPNLFALAEIDFKVITAVARDGAEMSA